MRFQRPVQFIQYKAGFYARGQVLRIDIKNFVEVFRVVQHDSSVDRLPTLRRSAPARQDRRFKLFGDRYRGGNILRRLRNNDGFWHHLVDRGVGCIAGTRGCVC